MIEYLADEVGPGGSQGVPMFEEEVDEQNCDVMGLHIEWDFDTNDGYKARAVDGPLKGQTWKVSISRFTKAKWDAVDEVHQYGVSHFDATPEQLKQAAWHYIEEHVKKLLA